MNRKERRKKEITNATKYINQKWTTIIASSMCKEYTYLIKTDTDKICK